MSLVKDLLLLLVTIIHISLMVSVPMNCEEKLESKAHLEALLGALTEAKDEFTKQVLNKTIWEENIRNPKLLEGITMPAGNMNDSHIRKSMYEISECLTSYLPKALCKLPIHKDVKTAILMSTRFFRNYFKNCWEEGELKVCPEHLANNQVHYEMKLFILEVLHTAVTWTENVTQRLGNVTQ